MAISKKWEGEGLQGMRGRSCVEPSFSCRNQVEQKTWPSLSLLGHLG